MLIMSCNKTPIPTRFLTPFFLIFFNYLTSIRSSTFPPSPPFNLSHFLYPKVTTTAVLTASNDPPSQPPHFLQSVLDAIAKKEKWALEDIRVSELDMKRAKYRSGIRYDLRVRFGKAEIALKMHEEMSVWKKLLSLRENGTENLEALTRSIASNAVIDSLRIEGPFELRVTSDDDQLSLTLPVNRTHSGLRQISVSQGITVEIRGAKQISMFHPSINQLPHGILTFRKLSDTLCTAPLPVRILGPASIIAYINKRPDTLIQTTFTSTDAIKLLPEKCFVEKPKDMLFSSLKVRIALLERVLERILNERTNKSYSALGSVKTRVKGLTLFRFQLELERDVRDDDAFWSSLAEWRTKPTIENTNFEVVARIEEEVLEPLFVRRVGPLTGTDSFEWSSLLSNVSFTKFPSVLVPPEALTLDVKW